MVESHEAADGSPAANDALPLLQPSQLDAFAGSVQTALMVLLQQFEQCAQPFSGKLPNELAEEFRSLDLDRPLPDWRTTLAELKRLYLRDAVYFHHPRYMAHLNCPVSHAAVAAELILSGVNSSVDTWDQSAGATLIEQRLIDWTNARIGLPDTADGIFTSGGTQSNLMGMLLAREQLSERLLGRNNREQGLPAEAGRYRIFASEMGHFSVQKAAALLGIGYQAVIAVACDHRYRMDEGALRDAIRASRARGEIPMAVVATAGSTDFGSIDPLPGIAALCEAENIWLHVDAAYGCGLLCAARYRHRLQGIEHADSVTVDYHKSFFQPVSCSAFLARRADTLNYVTHHAEYLNPLSEAEAGTPNLVNKSLQTTRRFDALKLWMSLRQMGPDQIGEMFESVIDLATAAHERLCARPRLEVLHRPELSTLVFRYLGTSAQPGETLDAINDGLRARLYRSGEATVAATRVHGRRYLKFTLLNPTTTLTDIDAVLDLIEQYGELEAEQQLKPMETRRVS